MFLSAVAACTNSSSGGSARGTVYGHELVIRDVISSSVQVTDSKTGALQEFALIFMGNATGLCADLTANARPPSYEGISIELAVIAGSPLTVSTPTSTGTFYVESAPENASLNTLAWDASCQRLADEPSESATTGSIRLTSLSGDVFAGDFSVSFANGDGLTGSFDPAPCPGLENFANPQMPLTCE
jgi:hypothetical protein